MPRAGQVLGLVGTNGIGKSTALKILAGKLKPNLGSFSVRHLHSCAGHYLVKALLGMVLSWVAALLFRCSFFCMFGGQFSRMNAKEATSLRSTGNIPNTAQALHSPRNKQEFAFL